MLPIYCDNAVIKFGKVDEFAQAFDRNWYETSTSAVELSPSSQSTKVCPCRFTSADMFSP